MLDNVKSDPFEIAKQNLIEPYGLTETNLFNLHNKLEVKGVDFADIYLQSIISESWNLEEGIVKGGAFSIDQGFSFFDSSSISTFVQNEPDIGSCST